MAANTAPIFVKTPRISAVAIATANTNRDGTGTTGTVFTAGADGSRIDKIIIKAKVTTTAGTIRLYIHDGAANFLHEEITVPAITATATVPAATLFSGAVPLVLPANYSLRASTEKAEGFNVIAIGGDY